jgi:hypothetical protein
MIMENKGSLIIQLVIFGLIGLGLLMLILTIWGCIPVGLGLLGLALCLKKIPAEPPHLGIVTIWGERKPKIKKEGWRFLAPFFPFFYDVILVNVEKKNQDLIPKNVRTKERAELQIRISMTWTPDKNCLIQYLNCGGEAGVRTILDDMVEEISRRWAAERSWEECLEANVATTGMLIKEIAGLEKEPEIKLVRQGNGTAPIESLGIILNRLNVGIITVVGKLVETAELKAIEEKEREAEKIEIDHVRERIQELIKTGFTPKEARDIVQTERKKVEKKITEIQGIDLEGLGRGIGHAFGKKGGKNNV